MTQTCPACGHPAEGRFCSQCGAGLEASVTCEECGNQLPRGGRYCNQCGAPTAATRLALAERAAARPPAPRLPWYIAGAAVVALVGVLALGGRDGSATDAPPATAPATAPFAAGAAGAGPAGDPRAVDLASMTPREAADRLFNRVMTAASQGDTTQAQTFLPMAIAAYARVDSIDADGRFHLAQLQRLNGDPAAELAQADSILEVDPNHLFGLFSAAEAYEAIGRTDEARARYRAFLDHLDAERARGLPEYADHEMLFPSMKEHAERAVE